MEKNLEQLAIITDEILTDPHVELSTILNAKKLASEDNYLYDLMVDWAKEVEPGVKDSYLNDIIEYTEEKLRTANLK